MVFRPQVRVVIADDRLDPVARPPTPPVATPPVVTPPVATPSVVTSPQADVPPNRALVSSTKMNCAGSSRPLDCQDHQHFERIAQPNLALRADQHAVQRANMDASPALPLQRVLHLCEGVGRVCGSNAVARPLLPRSHHFRTGHRLVLEAARRRDGRLAPPLKIPPPRMQHCSCNVHGGSALHVARDVRNQVVQQHVKVSIMDFARSPHCNDMPVRRWQP